MKKAGRPKKEINKIEFEKLCFLQCTQQEICDFFEIDHKTLTRWCKRTYGQEYSQVYDEKRSGGKIALRRTQFRLAERSASMAIWLGKQYLGQKDEVVADVSTNTLKNIQTIASLINNPAPDIDIQELNSEGAAAAETDAEQDDAE